MVRMWEMAFILLIDYIVTLIWVPWPKWKSRFSFFFVINIRFTQIYPNICTRECIFVGIISIDLVLETEN